MPKIDDGNGRVFFAPSSQVVSSPPVIVPKLKRRNILAA